MTLRLPLSITLAQAGSESTDTPTGDAPPTPPAGLQTGDGAGPQVAPGNGEGGGEVGTGQPGSPGQGGQQLPADDGAGSLFSPMLLLVVMALFFVMLFWGQHRDKKKKKEMLGAIGKGDKVQTVGGIMGTITEIRNDQIIVKVDENTNTKIKFNRSAIQSVLESKDEAGKSDES